VHCPWWSNAVKTLDTDTNSCANQGAKDSKYGSVLCQIHKAHQDNDNDCCYGKWKKGDVKVTMAATIQYIAPTCM